MMLYITLKLIFALSFLLFLLQVKLFINVGTENFSVELLQVNGLLFLALFALTSIFSLMLFLVLRLNVKNTTNLHIIKELKKSKDYFYSIFVDFFFARYQKILIYFTYLFLTYSGVKYIIFFLVIAPRFVIIFCLIQNIYCGQFGSYYYSLLLLILPLIVKIIIYMLKQIGPKLFPIYNEKTEKIEVEYFSFCNLFSTQEDIEIGLNLQFKRKYNQEDFTEFLTYYYVPLYLISKCMKKKFLPNYYKIHFVTLLIYYVIQIICWGYLLMLYFFIGVIC